MRAGLEDIVAEYDASALNDNSVFAQVFGRVMDGSEDSRVHIAEMLWNSVESQGRTKLEVLRKAASARSDLCSELVANRDRILEMRKSIVTLGQQLVQSGEVTLRLQLAFDKRKLAEILDLHRDSSEEALVLYKEALQLYQEDPSQQEAEIARTLGGIGISLVRLYRHKEAYEEALEFHQQALKIREKLFGENSAIVARTYFNIGWCYYLLQNFPQALQYFEKDLFITTNVSGKDAYDNYRAYKGLGDVYSKLRSFEEALTSYQKALAIQVEMLGSEHLEVAATFKDMGTVLKNIGRSFVILCVLLVLCYISL
jgi:tetratricopeptide (TPR) repeat protein